MHQSIFKDGIWLQSVADSSLKELFQRQFMSYGHNNNTVFTTVIVKLGNEHPSQNMPSNLTVKIWNWKIKN